MVALLRSVGEEESRAIEALSPQAKTGTLRLGLGWVTVP